MDFWQNAIWSVTPTIIIGIFFALIIRGVLSGDRRERAMRAQVEAEERARLGLPPRAADAAASSASSTSTELHRDA